MALNAIVLIAAGLLRERRWATWALAAAIAVTGVAAIKAVHDRADNPVPPSDTGSPATMIGSTSANWVAENTPTNVAIYHAAIEPILQMANRPPRSCHPKRHSPRCASIVEWSDRLHNIYYHEVDGLQVPVDSIADLGEEHVTAMAKKYGADYVIAYRDPAPQASRRIRQQHLCRVPHQALIR